MVVRLRPAQNAVMRCGTFHSCELRHPEISVRLSNRLQSPLDFDPAWLQKRRECECFAERLHRLVGCKARAVGGDFKQDAVGFTEIKATEVEAIDFAAVGNA